MTGPTHGPVPGGMSDTCRRGVGHVSEGCQSGVRPVSDTCQTGVRVVSDRCPTHVRDVSETRQTLALWIALALGILFCPCRVGAQTTAPPVRLTLDEAVRRGLETSHRIAEAVARGDAAEALVGQRHAAVLPQIGAQAGYTRTNHVVPFGVVLPNNQLSVIYPDAPDNYRTRLDLQWPIYTSGRLEALERAARVEATASADDIASARSDLTLEITRAYWGLVTAIDTLRVVEEAVKRIDVHLQDVRNQLDAGLVPPNDVLNVESQASRQRMLAIQARGVRDVSEAELGRLIGAPPGAAIDPSVRLAPPEATAVAADALIELARQQRPERAALIKHLTAAHERERAAAAGLKPLVAVGGGFDYARPNSRIFPRQDAWKPSWDASVNVNWPLFDGGKTRSDMAEAAAASRVFQERLAEFDSVLAVEIRQRLTELTSARAAIDSANDAVRSATEARRVVGERFSAGVATSTDVLDAHVAVLQSELDRNNAIAGARLAEARLARALGQ
jgi:outer membrane protein